MPLLPYSEAPGELLKLFNAEKESILARYYEPEPGLFIAESAKVTIRAFEAGYEIISMLIEDSQINREARQLFTMFPDIPAYHAPTAKYLEISGYTMTRGVLSLFRRKTRSRPASVSPGGSSLPILPDTFSRIAVLEEVGNPANIGSVFRNAAALGVDAVLLSKGCCDPLSRRCLRVSMGCVFQVPWYMTGLSGDKICEGMKAQGIRTAAMALSGNSISVADPALKDVRRLAVILGNEGNGLRSETIEACDDVVLIPMAEGVDSLNVAAASAVAFWELRHPYR